MRWTVKGAPDCAGRNVAHTPGPWYWGGGTAITRNGRYIHVENIRPHKEAVANARLIAASPELADCIHDLLYLHIAHHNHPLHAKARALLAKAEGRS